MPQKQVIHLYCLCWNEARILPYFLRHYDPIVDRYFVFDNGSNDGSLALLREDAKVETTHFEVAGDSFVEEELRLSETIWCKSRGQADWVFLVDIDEHVYHPDLRGYLARCSGEGVTAIRGIGYEMVADSFPQEDALLTELVVTGVRSEGYGKLCVFNPDALTATKFGPGRHVAKPEGAVVWPEHSELLLLHFKQLGVDYPIARSAELARGLKSRDLAEGWGRHYTWSPAHIARVWADRRAAAAPVPGLGILKHIPPEAFDEEAAVRRSGLFDAEWYLRTYPDVAAVGTDPVTHFCIHWREGRQPNLYFDPIWYTAAYPEAGADGLNPLLHYAQRGESEGAKPCEHFDPLSYRRVHGIAGSESPLGHCLAREAVARIEPPAGGAPDPMRHPEAPASPGSEIAGVPSLHALAGTLETPAASTEFRTALERGGLLDLVRLLLQAAPFDEEWYCSEYPDVAKAIDAGVIQSARRHFVEFGYFEGRRPIPDA